MLLVTILLESNQMVLFIGRPDIKKHCNYVKHQISVKKIFSAKISHTMQQHKNLILEC